MSVVLVIQHAMCMHHIILSSVAYLAMPYFTKLSHKQHDFGKKLFNIKCVFSGCTLKIGTEPVPKKLEKFYTLTLLSAREDFVEFWHRGSFKTYLYDSV